MKIRPGRKSGTVKAPPSKSHAHRILIANFLAGGITADLVPAAGDSDDVIATKRSLKALGGSDREVLLDCGESGSTLRFLSPVAAALGKKARFKTAGRLSSRPFIPYPELKSGGYELRGDVSSQFVTGLLFALPLVEGDSRISFSTPLESRGYVDMTLDVVRKAGVVIIEEGGGFTIPGSQRYLPQDPLVEGDWSAAAFWYAMNALGSRIEVQGLSDASAQPDRAISRLVPDLPEKIDVSQHPDIFPVLTVVAAARERRTVFTGISRLRIKECDRVAAMADVLGRFGAGVSVAEGEFSVDGIGEAFRGGSFKVYGDHRIAMSVAVGASVATEDVEIDDPGSAAKSYPGFFEVLSSLSPA